MKKNLVKVFALGAVIFMASCATKQTTCELTTEEREEEPRHWEHQHAKKRREQDGSTDLKTGGIHKTGVGELRDLFKVESDRTVVAPASLQAHPWHDLSSGIGRCNNRTN